MSRGRSDMPSAACQTDLPNPRHRDEMHANTDRMLEMIDAAVAGSAPFLPVRLVVFPEFAHAAPVFRDRRRAAGSSWLCRFRTSTPTGSNARPASTASTSRADR